MKYLISGHGIKLAKLTTGSWHWTMDRVVNWKTLVRIRKLLFPEW